MATEPTASRPSQDPARLFDQRAALLLVVLIIVGIVAFVLVNIGSSDTPFIVRAVFGFGVVILTIPYLLTIRGLNNDRPWARGVAAVLLGLVAFAGFVEIANGLSANRTTVPLAAIAALGILYGARGKVSYTVPNADRGTAAALIILALVGSAWPVVADQLLRPGSFLVVDKDALVLEVDADCGAAAADGSPRVAVTVRWRWTSRDVMPDGTDGLLVDWSADDDGLILGSTGPLPDGVWEGSGSPAATLIQPNVDGTSWTFGIDVRQAGQINGEVTLTLMPSRAGQSLHVLVQARYAHLDRWDTTAAAEPCDMPAA